MPDLDAAQADYSRTALTLDTAEREVITAGLAQHAAAGVLHAADTRLMFAQDAERRAALAHHAATVTLDAFGQ